MVRVRDGKAFVTFEPLLLEVRPQNPAQMRQRLWIRKERKKRKKKQKLLL